jgi:hypothetical protein|tara:strand:- start:346 stop:735 length:390 start_codon:yes stop_codon:yes gene_type:complete
MKTTYPMCEKCNETIARFSRQNFAEQISDLRLIGEYSRTQHYGGPEDGDWYYDTYAYKGNSAVFECWTKAKEAKSKLNKGIVEKVHWENMPESDNDFWKQMKVSTTTEFLLERRAGDADTTNDPVPHYE